jgi:FlaA1/EpsC-like NDP-sugar epimerase
MEIKTQIPPFVVKEQKNPNLVYLPDNKTMPIYSIRQQYREVRFNFHKQMNFAIGSFADSERMAKQYFLETYNIPIESWNYLKGK